MTNIFKIGGIAKFLFKFGATSLLLLVLFALSWNSLIKNYVPANIALLKHKIAQQERINSLQDTENQNLNYKIESMKNPNSPIVESEARYRLGLIKSGEIYYQY